MSKLLHVYGRKKYPEHFIQVDHIRWGEVGVEWTFLRKKYACNVDFWSNDLVTNLLTDKLQVTRDEICVGSVETWIIL